MLRVGPPDASSPGRCGSPRRGVQGGRRPGPSAAPELHRRAAGDRGVRLPSRRAARAVAADGEPSPEDTHGRGAPRTRAAGDVDVLPARPRARRSAARGVGAADAEGAVEALGMTLGRRAVAEGVGTALLVATVVGSGIMGERLAGGNVAVALLANTVATRAALVALILT